MPFTRITLKGLIPQETNFTSITLREQVYAKRLELKLTQKQAAKLIGVTPFTLLNWEKGHTEAIPMKAIPAITAFLGYDPFPEPTGVAEQLKAYRRRTGWSLKRLACHLGIDECTVGNWERGQLILFRRHRVLVAKFLGINPAMLHRTTKERGNAEQGERK